MYMMMLLLSYFYFLKNFWFNSLLMMLMSSLMICFISFYLITKKNNMNWIIIMMIMLPIFFFMYSNYIWKMYVWYEMVMIPMVIMIMGWGLNPYRFNSSFYFFMYSMFISLPIFIVIIINLKTLLILHMNYKNHQLSYFSCLLILLMFFVKTPIFFFHFWLPKAHVEASTMGSMILASSLLKMGSIGIIKIYYWSSMKFIYNNSFLILGVLMSSMISIIQSDIKKLIAYVSVLHMTLSILMLINTNLLSCKSFYIININHILISSSMFYYCGLIYMYSKSRLIYLQQFTKYNLNFYYLIWMLLLNMSIPPFFSFFGEILAFSSLMLMKSLLVMFIILTILLTILYTLLFLTNMKIYSSMSIKLFSYFIMFIFNMSNMMFWFLKKKY